MTDKRRLFFAVWPDAPAVKYLHEAARDAQRHCGGRLMCRETLHLTLAFLGEVPAARVADATAVADDMSFAPFTLTLDRLDYWKHNRILWAGGESAELAMLATSLGDGLRAAGFRLDARPFVAHLTLLREARCEAPPVADPVAWPVREFTLVESNLAPGGSRYDIIGRWPATGCRGNESLRR